MSTVNERAQSLSDELMKANPQLDATFDTLKELEKLVAASKNEWSLQHMQKFGAYFGEVIRTAMPEAQWVDYETAEDLLRGLEWGEDINMILQHERQCVFPLVKVTKYLYNGTPDSIVAFGPAAVNMLRGTLVPRQQDNQPVDPDKFTEWKIKSVESINAFFQEPNDQHLKRLAGATGHLRDEEIEWVLKKHTAEPAIFTRFFDRKDEGRGAKTFRPGLEARDWLWRAVKAEAVRLETAKVELNTLLQSGDKAIQERAAWALTRILFTPKTSLRSNLFSSTRGCLPGKG